MAPAPRLATPRPRAQVDIVVDELRRELDQADAFDGDVAENFIRVVAAVVRFVAVRLDAPPEYMREDGKGADALEADLHTDLWEFLKSGALTEGFTLSEPQKVGGGRADIGVVFPHQMVVNELKRERNNAGRAELEAAYSAQGSSYSATDYPLGLVTVLDLTASPTDTPTLRSCFWVHQYVSGADDKGRWLVFARVPGRLLTPSEHTS